MCVSAIEVSLKFVAIIKNGSVFSLRFFCPIMHMLRNKMSLVIKEKTDNQAVDFTLNLILNLATFGI